MLRIIEHSDARPVGDEQTFKGLDLRGALVAPPVLRREVKASCLNIIRRDEVDPTRALPCSSLLMNCSRVAPTHEGMCCGRQFPTSQTSALVVVTAAAI